MKKCSRCKRYKPENQFCKEKKAKDGLTTMCKYCLRIHSREYDRNRTRSKQQREKRAESDRKRRRQNRDKTKAYGTVRQEIRTGKIKKQNCEVCGKLKVHAHHDDYNKPLVIRWLCTVHHAEVHYGKVE